MRATHVASLMRCVTGLRNLHCRSTRDKTRLIEFGRFAANDRKLRGLGKPETFTFLGFTFICGRSRRGNFQLQRKTRRDRLRGKLRDIKAGAATSNASADPGAGKMAEAGRGWPLRLLRGPEQ